MMLLGRRTCLYFTTTHLHETRGSGDRHTAPTTAAQSGTTATARLSRLPLLL